MNDDTTPMPATPDASRAPHRRRTMLLVGAAAALGLTALGVTSAVAASSGDGDRATVSPADATPRSADSAPTPGSEKDAPKPCGEAPRPPEEGKGERPHPVPKDGQAPRPAPKDGVTPPTPKDGPTPPAPPTPPVVPDTER